MAYYGGSVTAGTAAAVLCTPGDRGVMVSNNGGAAVTIGGANVVPGVGVVMPANSGPVFFPARPDPGQATDEALHCVGTASAGVPMGYCQVV